ncbi:NAD(P)/FAD-dependent oxidoreductase [Seongchinamella sediminis]|uniref:NAD(P)/FAD-dependent oxidoreductase n=1 Tax=Seongchinamella sediminis TaxID=2283635 RepID=A0A3L7DWF5_9GAMM|nr:FAD-dependent oxidoreductase [Seongchinamella sediminis]RLQ21466.1 NAD(P)/FAD-dependent oxidoreductase [Seongchinamella sediminis]
MRDVLIIGGGFAGLSAAVVAADENDKAGGDLCITLVNPVDGITIRPRLYECDPGTLRPALRPTLDPAGVVFVESAAEKIDTTAKTVTLATGEALFYDTLILATGSEMPLLAVPGFAGHAFNIDTLEAAVALDEHLSATVSGPEEPGRDSYVIVGGGMTGIELATEMPRRIAAHGGADAVGRSRIVLVERAAEVGPGLGVNPRPIIADALLRAGVEMRLGRSVASVDADGATLDDGERIAAKTVVTTVGLRANALTAQIPGERDSQGRLCVDDYQRVKGVDAVYATGDVAHALADDGSADGGAEQIALMSCQHARTMGKYAGFNAARAMLGLPPQIYRQADYVTCLDLGDYGAVFTAGWRREVQATGHEAKKIKTMINTQLIYPPRGTREEVFAAMRINERGR